MQAQNQEGKPVRTKHKALDVDEKWVQFVDDSISASWLHPSESDKAQRS